MKSIIRAMLPPLVGAMLILGGTLLLPQAPKMLESCVSPDLPTGYSLLGWQGIKTQESEQERAILAQDTRFSKARYTQVARVPWEKPTPTVDVSIVYSGQDINHSIHRPERCLPAQGHMDVQGTESELTLADGRVIKLTRLDSRIPMPEHKEIRLHFIHYYFFIGRHSIHHTHMGRTIQDMADRVFRGETQSWAYFQAGTCWAPEIGVSKEEADKRLRTLISDLLPRQIDWKALER